jgi:hypothetical protein
VVAKNPAPSPALAALPEVPPAVAEFIASASIEALVGHGRASVQARRSLAELAGVLGDVLRRARARARDAATRRLLGRCDTAPPSSGPVP